MSKKKFDFLVSVKLHKYGMTLFCNNNSGNCFHTVHTRMYCTASREAGRIQRHFIQIILKLSLLQSAIWTWLTPLEAWEVNTRVFLQTGVSTQEAVWIISRLENNLCWGFTWWNVQNKTRTDADLIFLLFHKMKNTKSERDLCDSLILKTKRWTFIYRHNVIRVGGKVL